MTTWQGPYAGPLEQVDDCCCRIPKSYKPGMRVDGLIFADEQLLEQIRKDQAPEQVANVAFLPGIQHASLAMPDIHWGYGFCIGGVCATDPDEGGVISPGGVGYDINCGVRLVRTNLFYRDVKPHVRAAGRGTVPQRPDRRRPVGQVQVRRQGAAPPAGRGAALPRRPRPGDSASDIDHTEAHGRLDGADPDAVSDHAVNRGAEQCGTLGSGNHFLEVQVVDHVFDADVGRRVRAGEGHGLRDDPHRLARPGLPGLRRRPGRRCATRRQKYGIELPDRQLACAPVDSPEGQKYIGGHAGGGQLRLVQPAAADAAGPRGVRGGLRPVVAGTADEPDLRRGHNIAKFEEHTVDGKTKRVWVHRKGATRAFPPGHPEVPAAYRTVGQPVIIPGDMGRASWVLVGQPGSMETDVRHDLPRRRPGHEPHRRRQGRRRPAHRQGTGGPRRHRPRRRAARASRRSSRTRTRTSMTWSRWSTRPACRGRWPGCGRSASSRGEAMGTATAAETAFWAAIAAAPDDDLPKLVFADWLDERGDSAGPCLRWVVAERQAACVRLARHEDLGLVVADARRSDFTTKSAPAQYVLPLQPVHASDAVGPGLWKGTN